MPHITKCSLFVCLIVLAVVCLTKVLSWMYYYVKNSSEVPDGEAVYICCLVEPLPQHH